MTEPWVSPVPPPPPVWQPQPPRRARPGVTTAAAVLGFVQAGLAILGGVFTVFGAAGASAEEREAMALPDAFRTEVADHIGLLTIVGIVVIAGSGVLIGGSVTLLSGRNRPLYLSGMALQLALSVCYLVMCVIAQSDDADEGAGFAVVAVLYAVMPVIGMSLSAGSSTKVFLQATSEDERHR